MDQSKVQRKARKGRREEPEKEPTKPLKEIESEEDALEKVVRGLEYKFLLHQFYRAKL